SLNPHPGQVGCPAAASAPSSSASSAQLIDSPASPPRASVSAIDARGHVIWSTGRLVPTKSQGAHLQQGGLVAALPRPGPHLMYFDAGSRPLKSQLLLELTTSADARSAQAQATLVANVNYAESIAIILRHWAAYAARPARLCEADRKLALDCLKMLLQRNCSSNPKTRSPWCLLGQKYPTIH
uniref:Ras-GEF domain-containing protein n=1 Tax=Macrostomum lignano TaxID=282301 RepID=A0A1I8FAP5_9PLAT